MDSLPPVQEARPGSIMGRLQALMVLLVEFSQIAFWRRSRVETPVTRWRRMLGHVVQAVQISSLPSVRLLMALARSSARASLAGSTLEQDQVRAVTTMRKPELVSEALERFGVDLSGCPLDVLREAIKQLRAREQPKPEPRTQVKNIKKLKKEELTSLMRQQGMDPTNLNCTQMRMALTGTTVSSLLGTWEDLPPQTAAASASSEPLVALPEEHQIGTPREDAGLLQNRVQNARHRLNQMRSANIPVEMDWEAPEEEDLNLDALMAGRAKASREM